MSRSLLIEGIKICTSCGEEKPRMTGFSYGHSQCKLCVKCIRRGIPLDEQRRRQASDRVSLLPDGVIRDNPYPHAAPRMQIEVVQDTKLPKIDDSEEKIAKLTEELDKREKAIQSLTLEMEEERKERIKQMERMESLLRSTTDEKQIAIEHEAFLRQRIVDLQSDFLLYKARRKELRRDHGKETEEERRELDKYAENFTHQIRRLKHKHEELTLKPKSKTKAKKRTDSN